MRIGGIGHPSLKRLHRWVAGEDLPLEEHLSTCEYCADRLEPMLDDFDDSIKFALLRLLNVPEELPERIQAGIDERLENQRDLLLIGELFGLPLQTARVITATEQQGEE